MREIKFRLRDRHNKVVGYEKWYTGSWHPDNPDEGFSLNSGWWEASPCWLYSTDNERWTPIYILHRYKDQYTGLKDKNGKEIYEGDILSYPNSSTLRTVTWHNGCWWRTFNREFSTRLCEWNSYEEVIGNIYENEDLLK